MTANVQLEPEAQEFAQSTANPPYVYDLGREKGRQVRDQVQSGPIAKLPVGSVPTSQTCAAPDLLESNGWTSNRSCRAPSVPMPSRCRSAGTSCSSTPC